MTLTYEELTKLRRVCDHPIERMYVGPLDLENALDVVDELRAKLRLMHRRAQAAESMGCRLWEKAEWLQFERDLLMLLRGEPRRDLQEAENCFLEATRALGIERAAARGETSTEAVAYIMEERQRIRETIRRKLRPCDEEE